MIGVLGPITLPGAGVATALAVALPAGNQLMIAAPACSQLRGAADTDIEPACALFVTVKSVCGDASTSRFRGPPVGP